MAKSLTDFEIAFKALCDQVKTAKIRDKECLDHLEASRTEWKAANEELTSAYKMLDTFLSNAKNDLTRVASGDETRVNPKNIAEIVSSLVATQALSEDEGERA